MLTSAKDTANIACGVVIAAVGVAAAIHSAGSYEIGSMNAMGPGMFPLMLGVILAVLGSGIAAVALLSGERLHVRPEWRPAIFILGALAVFGLTVERLGLLPAVAIAIFVSSRADSRLSLKGLLILCLVLCGASWLMLHFASMPIKAFDWRP